MKKRLLITLVFAVMLIAALSITASAKWWDENPFKDVKSDAWYYDAVRICNENELFNGTSNTTFTPSMKMSRAMLAQVLANADGYNKADYQGSSFKDVKATAWYASAVEWANQKGITTGVGGGKFAPDTLISREQLATMLRRYAEYKGMDIDATADFDSFADGDKVSEWAKGGVEWAVANGVVKGADVKGTLYLNPQNTAARSECAQMLSNFLYIEPVYEINGNDISLYTIVRPSNCLDFVEEAADALSTYIEMSIGIKLPVVTDESPVGEYEILVGETNREAQGIVTIDRAGFEDDTDFLCSVQGNYLVLAGIDSDSEQDDGSRTTYNINGSENAVFYFLEKEFGLSFYFDNGGIIAEPDPIISFEDGYEYIDGPYMESRSFYIHDESNIGSCGSGNYYSEWGCGLPHQLGNLMTGAWKYTYENTWDTPCLSDPENIQSLKDNISELLEKKSTLNLVGLVQNDSQFYCKCKDCMSIYRAHGRSAVLILLCNEICETFEKEYPNVKFATWAYNWSIDPPRDLVLHDNMILYYNTLHLCPAHEYSDTSCKFNNEASETIKKWGDITAHMYLWEHTGAFTDAMTPFPDLDSIRQNTKFLADNGVEGVFLNSMDGQQATFCELRGFLFNRLYRDPYMSEEEYYYLMDHFLELFYGEGWKFVRSYIDEITELGNTKCHGFHTDVTGYYDFEEVAAHIDEFDAYWADAMAKAETEEQKDRLFITNMSWRYLRQCVLYSSKYTNGTEKEKLAYMADSEKLYNDIMERDIRFTENGDPSFNVYVSPANWN
ncbi:MAG: DUF4838 domain-containing protein [Ruminococcaceae bacterium]|nr:DUF4838 domain-containing protein [Oscillospiraceae bacterium]